MTDYPTRGRLYRLRDFPDDPVMRATAVGRFWFSDCPGKKATLEHLVVLRSVDSGAGDLAFADWFGPGGLYVEVPS